MLENKRVSETLVRFLYNLEYDDLPFEVVLQAKRCLIDYLGAVLGGTATETADKIKRFLLRFGDEGENTVIGYRMNADIFKAAMANAITSHVLELDDGERHATLHPGSSIISTVLALVEKEKADGRKAITAIVAGYETAIRVGRAVQPSHRNRGFHGTATCGTLGAAMAAAKLLNLSEQEMTYALGIAGTSASGFLQFLEDGSEIKQYHPGKAAVLGLLAAYLAESGLTAPTDILEGKRGFFNALSDNYNISKCTDGLGKEFAIMDVYFKPYAACRHCHAPIQAILNLRENHKFEIGRIEKIKVLTYKSAVDGHSDPNPKSEVGAKMSVPYSVAVALKTGWAGIKEFTPVFFNDKEVSELASKVEVMEDPSLSSLVPHKRPAVVEVITNDGKIFSDKVDLPLGEPESPIEDEVMSKKFKDLALTCCSEKDIEEILEIIKNAENQIGNIFKLLR